jgi:hypothetical protein
MKTYARKAFCMKVTVFLMLDIGFGGYRLTPVRLDTGI